MIKAVFSAVGPNTVSSWAFLRMEPAVADRNHRGGRRPGSDLPRPLVGHRPGRWGQQSALRAAPRRSPSVSTCVPDSRRHDPFPDRLEQSSACPFVSRSNGAGPRIAPKLTPQTALFAPAPARLYTRGLVEPLQAVRLPEGIEERNEQLRLQLEFCGRRLLMREPSVPDSQGTTRLLAARCKKCRSHSSHPLLLVKYTVRHGRQQPPAMTQ